MDGIYAAERRWNKIQLNNTTKEWIFRRISRISRCRLGLQTPNICCSSKHTIPCSVAILPFVAFRLGKHECMCHCTQSNVWRGNGVIWKHLTPSFAYCALACRWLHTYIIYSRHARPFIESNLVWLVLLCVLFFWKRHRFFSPLLRVTRNERTQMTSTYYYSHAFVHGLALSMRLVGKLIKRTRGFFSPAAATTSLSSCT